MLNSDLLLTFLQVVRRGNALAAARAMGVDHSTVIRRLTQLEAALDTRLFDRSPRGLAPTAAALALVTGAEKVEAAIMAATDDVVGRDGDISGTVRLATPEIFGTFLVAPNIAGIAERHPRLVLELSPESRSISLSKREADIAITLRRPPRGRLIARKLTDFRLGLYASRSYLEQHPTIETLKDVESHGFVSYIDELVASPEMVALDYVVPDARVVFRSSSSIAQHLAVTAGLGLGILHVLASEKDDRLVRILVDEVEVVRSYWLVVHSDLSRLPRVRAVMDFLEELIVDHAPIL
ncbi:LysR family transcriptional regulator [Novosphingobium pentaromativorans]|nr:LysR family transcriptional regulator [Novosphingobium pentaromativorans]AIT79842.1 LysR family transcriptional regulator [Novosphingobium pentaromativorans US6-1]